MVSQAIVHERLNRLILHRCADCQDTAGHGALCGLVVRLAQGPGIRDLGVVKSTAPSSTGAT